MKQMYYYIAEGHPKAEALRLAKMRFLKSGTLLSSPRYWAAFVLNGDGWNTSRRIIPWSTVAAVVAFLLALVSLALWWSSLQRAGILRERITAIGRRGWVIALISPAVYKDPWARS